ncbi:transcriptional regulator [Actinomycetaceae bacterium TAE3-ERU4]|nr:transcriptional regulator [Actinomycetaceae bacterium TAE3-ERU4]
MYYLNFETMDSIARALGVSRSTVSRLLGYARETGIVRISVDSVIKSDTAMALEDTFGVNATTVSIHRPLTAVARLSLVARVAAEHLSEMVKPDSIIGIAWGNTTSEVMRHVTPTGRQGITVVQMNGSASSMAQGFSHAEAVLSRAAEVFSAEVMQFPVPAFFDYAQTREALWRERSVQCVRKTVEEADIAVFGVGAFDSVVPSLVYSGGYLEPHQIAQLSNSGVVGDVATVLLRADGTWRDIELNARASGPNPDILRKIPRRLAIVSGIGKAKALLGALRANTITDLIVDEDTAQAVLELARKQKMLMR